MYSYNRKWRFWELKSVSVIQVLFLLCPVLGGVFYWRFYCNFKLVRSHFLFMFRLVYVKSKTTKDKGAEILQGDYIG